jgi:hypothetical protein
VAVAVAAVVDLVRHYPVLAEQVEVVQALNLHLWLPLVQQTLVVAAVLADIAELQVQS